MKNLIALVGVLCVVAAIPVPESKPQSSLDLLQIPFGNNKELDIVSLSDDSGKISERNKRTIDILRQLFPTLTQSANSEDGADPTAINEELVQTIRRVREAAAVAEKLEQEKEKTEAQDRKFDVKVELPSDQEAGASESEDKSAALDELTLDNEADDDNRGKRFLSFGGSSAGGSGGGSGNFLFDIVRNTADRVARAAGTVYRVVAGTESIDNALPAAGSSSSSTSSSSATSAALVSATDSNATSSSSSSTNTTNNNNTSDDQDDADDNLISGSSGTQETDERANSADAHGSTESGYTEGIPGPVTRLVVLANRGLSNLIQDLILRLAQTSERVVNFKARLITSLI